MPKNCEETIVSLNNIADPSITNIYIALRLGYTKDNFVFERIKSHKMNVMLYKKRAKRI